MERRPHSGEKFVLDTISTQEYYRERDERARISELAVGGVLQLRVLLKKSIGEKAVTALVQVKSIEEYDDGYNLNILLVEASIRTKDDIDVFAEFDSESYLYDFFKGSNEGYLIEATKSSSFDDELQAMLEEERIAA